MPRPRPGVDCPPLRLIREFALPEECIPPSPRNLPTPILPQLWLTDDAISRGEVKEQQDDGADWRETASLEADGDSAATTKGQSSSASSAQGQSESIMKALMEELGTRFNAYDQSLLASMSLQMQEVKLEILHKLDEQDSQISAVHEELVHVREQSMGPVFEDAFKVAPLLDVSMPETSNQQNAQDASSTNSCENKEATSGERLDSNAMLPVWQVQTSADLEAADEDHRRASVAFSAQQSASFISTAIAKPPATKLQQIVQSTTFESISMVVILTNALFVGVQTELSTLSVDDQDSDVIFYINFAYTLCFTVELTMKLIALGRSFFSDRYSWHWNCLDAFTVIASLLECSLGLVIRTGGQSAKVQGVSQLRVLRMLRLVRLLRGLKIARTIKSIRALRTLVHQILFTVKSMMWAMFLLFIIIYLFAVSFTQAANMHRLDKGWTSLELEQLDDPRLHRYWSSLPRSMSTLFMSITGGVSWEEASYPLGDVGGAWVCMFLAYICFAQMAVLNVITGYFCQSAVEGASLDPDLVAQKILASKRMYTSRIAEIFAEIDADGSGYINLHEFEEHLKDDHTKAYFDSLGIDASDVWTLFKLMDADSGHQIDLEEFTDGCLRLSGGAKSLDLAKLAHDQEQLCKHLRRFIGRTDRALVQLTGGRMCSLDTFPERA